MHIYLSDANKYAIIFFKIGNESYKTNYLTLSNGCIIILKYDFYAKIKLFHSPNPEYR